MGKTMGEYALVLRARHGDTAALSQLLEPLRGSLFAVAYAHLHHYDDAQDAVASGVLRACRSIDKLQKPEAFRAWLFQIVRNEANRIRESRFAPVPAHDENLDAAAEEEGSVIFRMDVENALRALPRDQARAFSLFYRDGLPVAAIAAQLARPEGTVKYWLHRGRQTLSHELKGYASMPEKPLPQPLTAAIISTDLSPDLLIQMQVALTNAGWSNIQTRSDFADLGKQPLGENEPPHDLWKNKLLVLDEWINGRSVFEYLPLLRGRKSTKDTALFVLADGGRDRQSFDITVCSAYVSGVDMLLTKPFDIAEFQSFARRTYEDVQKSTQNR